MNNKLIVNYHGFDSYKEVNYLQRLSINPKLYPFRNVVMIGNGAVCNGDKPLHEWFQKIHKNVQDLKLIDGYKINYSTILAKEAIKYRIMRGYSNNLESAMKELSLLNKAKEDLCKIYRDHFERGKITSRSTPDILNDIIQSKETLVICYNWDPVFWRLKNHLNKLLIKNILYVHGSCYNPESIVLPCEFLMDYSDKNKKNYLSMPDVHPENLNILLGLHGLVLESLTHENLENLFIWGLSLNDYDAEIIFLLSESISSRSKKNVSNPKMCIINPDLNAAYRAAYLTEIYKFDYFDPSINAFAKIEI